MKTALVWTALLVVGPDASHAAEWVRLARPISARPGAQTGVYLERAGRIVAIEAQTYRFELRRAASVLRLATRPGLALQGPSGPLLPMGPSEMASIIETEIARMTPGLNGEAEADADFIFEVSSASAENGSRATATIEGLAAALERKERERPERAIDNHAGSNLIRSLRSELVPARGLIERLEQKAGRMADGAAILGPSIERAYVLARAKLAAFDYRLKRLAYVDAEEAGYVANAVMETLWAFDASEERNREVAQRIFDGLEASLSPRAEAARFCESTAARAYSSILDSGAAAWAHRAAAAGWAVGAANAGLSADAISIPAFWGGSVPLSTWFGAWATRFLPGAVAARLGSVLDRVLRFLPRSRGEDRRGPLSLEADRRLSPSLSEEEAPTHRPGAPVRGSLKCPAAVSAG